MARRRGIGSLKQWHIIVIIVAIFAIAGTGAWYYMRKSKPAAPPPMPAPQTAMQPVGTPQTGTIASTSASAPVPPAMGAVPPMQTPQASFAKIAYS